MSNAHRTEMLSTIEAMAEELRTLKLSSGAPPKRTVLLPEVDVIDLADSHVPEKDVATRCGTR